MSLVERFGHHPAREMGQRSIAAVEAGDRDGWLALFAPDGTVEDPIGPSPFDREGKGHQGRDAIGAFYDKVISMGQVRFEVRESYAAGDECVNVGTVTTTLPDGTRAIVDGVFMYRIDAEGRLAALRGMWELDRLRIE